MNLSILICQELWPTPLYSYLISSSEQLCKVSTTVSILQIKKQIIRELKLICPGSTILKIAKTWLWTSALKVHTSLLPYPIFDISIRHVPPLEVICMLLFSVQLKKTQVTVRLHSRGESLPKLARGQVPIWKILLCCKTPRRNIPSSL